MKRSSWRLLCICFLMLIAQDAIAKCGAGTVLYFKIKHETYLLLADHSLSHQRNRGWSGFGGRCDSDPPDTAAARETEEETKGFYGRKEILDKINSRSKIRVGNFTTYFVEVDFVPAIVINNQKISDSAAHFRERSPYAWIPVSVVWQAIAKRQSERVFISAMYLPPDSRTDWFFEPFVASLVAAKNAGILPWER